MSAAGLNPIARHRARCHQVRGRMSDYLDGELEQSLVQDTERHLRWCPSCRRVLANLRRTVEGLRGLGGPG